MATITYTATHPQTGRIYTRTSGSMFYTHAVIGCGVTFHTSAAAARKASTSGQHRSVLATVVPAVPTAINGRASLGEFIGHPQADAIDALIAAKNAPKVKTGPSIRATLGEPRPVGRGRAELDAADAANRENNRAVLPGVTLRPPASLQADHSAAENAAAAVEARHALAEAIAKRDAALAELDAAKKALRRAEDAWGDAAEREHVAARAAAQKLPCPACGAAAGQLCFETSLGSHVGRIDAARDAAAGLAELISG